MIFSEVERIYGMSPILQEACARPPTKQSDKCHLTFRQAGKTPASVIESVPLGDGGKIRGARYYVIIADEFAQLPADIFNLVIVPMGATSANPMERVRAVQKQQKLIELGLATADDFKEETANKMIMTSSAYYQFNHMYDRVLTYDRLIEDGSTKHANHNISYKDLPKGFMSEENIIEARNTSTEDQFKMEYEAVWLSDSAGIFKASLIDRCKMLSNHTVALNGSPGKEYILGVDPARTRDAFAMCMIEVGSVNKVVGAWEFFNQDFPSMAAFIFDLSKRFNLVAIHMDSQGGGAAIKDLLEEEARFGKDRILDADDDANRHAEGRKILYLANFSPKWIADANYASINLMEKGGLAFPVPAQTKDDIDFRYLEEMEKTHDTVDRMLGQMLSIEVSESRAGVAHFDLPEGAHGKKKKDLYTAFILAAKKAYDIAFSQGEVGNIIRLGLVEPLRIGSVTRPTNQLQDMGVMPADLTGWGYRNFR